jgi:hypothetical protein
MRVTNELTNSERIRLKLVAFSRLAVGWKNGRGGALSYRALRDATSINSYAAWFALETDAFMGIDNDVTLAIYHEGKDYSFHVSSTGVVTFDSELQDIPKETGLSIGDCFAKINLIASYKWKLSYSYTWLISTPSFGDFGAWLSNHQATKAASLSSLWIVSSREAVPSVHMPLNFTPASLLTHRSSGALIPTESRPLTR